MDTEFGPYTHTKVTVFALLTEEWGVEKEAGVSMGCDL
jgi:hypothetical protein